jgi:hypothetical protein
LKAQEQFQIDNRLNLSLRLENLIIEKNKANLATCAGSIRAATQRRFFNK